MIQEKLFHDISDEDFEVIANLLALISNENVAHECITQTSGIIYRIKLTYPEAFSDAGNSREDTEQWLREQVERRHKVLSGVRDVTYIL